MRRNESDRVRRLSVRGTSAQHRHPKQAQRRKRNRPALNIESLEARLLLSASDPYLQPFPDPGVVHALTWQGKATLAYEGEWIVQIDPARLEAGVGPQPIWSQPLGTLSGKTQPQTVLEQTRDGGSAALSQLSSGTYLLQARPTVSERQILTELKSLPGFRSIEPNFLLAGQATIPDDPRFEDQWGLRNTGQTGGTVGADVSAPGAWDRFTGSSTVVIAHLDSGVDYRHADLAANMWMNPGEIPADGLDNDGNGYIDDVYGIDTINGDSDPFDDDGHGTHSAGILGAVGNNGVGVAGVNWNVRIMALKFLNRSGNGSTAAAIEALNYITMMATQYGVNIVASNNSWGGGGFSQALLDAIEASTNAGILFVAAAGNSSRNEDLTPFYPASYSLDGILSVAATDDQDQLAEFSNFGPLSVDLGAPGAGILSTAPGNSYGYVDGTSTAAPHVTGTVGLLAGRFPNATPADIKTAILATVDSLPTLSTVTQSGGRLNIHHALDALHLRVESTQPEEGEVVFTPPTVFVLDFSDSVDSASVDAADLLVNNFPADQVVQVDPDTLEFTYFTSPVTSQGLETISVAAGSVLRSADQSPILAYTGSFRYDETLLQVTTTDPADGSVVPVPLTTITLDFNEPVDESSVLASDLQLSRGQVVGFSVLDGDSIQFSVADLTTEDEIEFSLAAGAVTDTFGNPSDSFLGQLSLDVVTAPLASPLTPLVPLGSLVYTSSQDGVINAAGDFDNFTIQLDVNQTVSIVLRAEAGLQASVALLDPDQTEIDSASATSAGQSIALQNLPTTAAGSYTVAVTELNGTTGGYRIAILLNAGLEEESLEGASNDSPGAAQLLGPYLDLDGSVARLAVLGGIEAGPAGEFYRLDAGAGESLTITVQGESDDVSITLLDRASNPLAKAVRNPDDTYSIPNFAVASSSELYVEIRSTAQQAYSLLVTRGADFERSGHDDFQAAQSISSTAGVLGHVTGIGNPLPASPDDDWFRIAVNAGDRLTLQTLTPADGPGEFLNDLDPRIELWGPAGSTVGADDNSAPDGRNARLDHVAVESGDYRVRVHAAPGTAGEYLLQVSGATGSQAALAVLAIEPNDGQRVAVFPPAVRVQFSQPLLLTSVDPEDLLVNNIPAFNVNVIDGQTFEFVIDPAVDVGDGEYSVEMVGGAVVDLQGVANSPLAAQFVVDRRGPVITQTTWNGLALPAGGILPRGSLEFAATFDESLREDMLSPDDLVLTNVSTGSVHAATSFSYDSDSRILSAVFPDLGDGEYVLQLFSGDGALQDEVGNDLDGEPLGAGLDGTPTGNGVAGGDYVVSFLVDVDSHQATLPLEPRTPLGSLIYRGTDQGVITSASDEDRLTIDLDPNQSLVVVLMAGASLQSSLVLEDPQGAAIASALAAEAGDSLTLPLTAVVDEGTYSILISGLNGTTGTYEVRLELNTSLEQEATSGAGNNDPGTAEDLTASFLTLDAANRRRGAVTGLADGPAAVGPDAIGYRAVAVPFTFEDISGTGTRILEATDDDVVELSADDLGSFLFAFPFYGRLYSHIFVSSNGLLTFVGEFDSFANNDLTSSPVLPTIAPFWDDLVTDGDTDDAVYWQVLGSGSSLRLVVQWNDVSYVTGDAADLITFQAVLHAADGAIQFNYLDLTGDTLDSEGASATVGIKDAGVQGGNRLLVSLDAGPNDLVASGHSTLITRSAIPQLPDYYRFNMGSGELASLVMHGGGEPASLELVDPDGTTLLATGVRDNGTGQAIHRFIAPATGDYFARVFGATDAEYQLAITRQVDFDGERNDEADFAQDLSGLGASLGHVGGSLAAGGMGGSAPDEDWYAVQVTSGDVLEIATQSPGGGPAQFLNTVDLGIELFDPEGTPIPHSNSLGDESLVRTASLSGTYRLRVFAENDTRGEYLVSITGATGTSNSVVVRATNPPRGAHLPVFPLTMVVTFSESLLLSSVEASDLSINGVPALSVTHVDGQSLQFTLDPTTDVGHGNYSVEVNAGAVVDLQGTANEAYNGQFVVDQRGPRVLQTRWNGAEFPQDTLLPLGPLEIQFFLDEPLLTPDEDDLVLVETISGAEFVPIQVSYAADTSIVTVQYSELPEGNYVLTMRSGDGAIEDLAGNDLDGEPIGASRDGTLSGDTLPGGDYVVHFEIDRQSFPAEHWERVRPLGSFIGLSSQNSSRLGPYDDDTFQVLAQAGETLTAIATPTDPAVRLCLEIVGVTDRACSPDPLGSLSEPGERDVYVFAGQKGTQLFFDGQIAGTVSTVQLRSPSGSLLMETGSGLDAPPIWLTETGDYRLTVFAQGGDTGQYRFQLSDTATAATAQFNTLITRQLTAPQETHLYRFEGNAGQRLHLIDTQGGTCQGSWSLFGPSGDSVASNPCLGSGSSDTVELPASGRYVLALENGSVPLEYAVRLNDVSDPPVVPSGFGTEYSGMLPPGESETILMRSVAGARFYYDALERTSLDVSIEIQDPIGDAFHQGPAGIDMGPLSLAAGGVYLIEVTNNSSSESHPYRFQLLDFSTATPASFESMLQGTLDPGTQTVVRRFTGVAGQRLYLDGHGAANCDGEWSLYSPHLDQLASQCFGLDGEVVLEYPGEYYLTFIGLSDAGPIDYELTVGVPTTTSSALAFGVPVVGSLAEAGQRHIFEFQAVAGDQIILDGMDDDLDLTTVMLVDPQGDVLFSSTSTQGDADQIEIRQSGRHSLIFTAGDAPEDYAFQILSRDEASAVSLDQPVTGELSDGTQLALFQFDGLAGQRLLFDTNAQTCAFSWTIYSPDLQPLAANCGSVDSSIVLPSAGQYALLIAGQASGVPIAYEFTLRTTQTVELPLTLDSPISGTISVPGQRFVYRFPAAAGDRLYFDGQQMDLDNTMATLFGPSGILFSQDSDFDSIQPVTVLSPGEYTVEISAVGDQLGDFEFQLRDVQSAPLLSVGDQAAAGLPTGQESAVFRISGVAGQRIRVADEGSALLGGQAILFRPDNQFLELGQFGDDVESLLPIDGEYVLVAAGADAAAAEFVARLLDISDTPVNPSGFDTLYSDSLNPGEEHVIDLDAPAGVLAFFDSLDADGDPLLATLFDPHGGVVFSTDANSDAGPFLLEFSGTYELRVAGAGPADAGSYQFAVRNMNAAPIAFSEAPITGALDPGLSSVFYRIEGSAGQTLYVQSNGNPLLEAGYQLFRPDGSEATAAVDLSSDLALRFAETGTFWLHLSGNGTSATVPYSLLPFISSPTHRQIVGPSSIMGELTVSGEEHFWSFSGTAGDWIVWDSLEDDFDPITMQVIDPRGQLLLAQNADDDSGPIQLTETGDYQIRILGNRTTGDYRFRILQGSASPTRTIPLDTTVVGRLETAIGIQPFRFDGAAGQRLLLDDLGMNPCDGMLSLFGPFGQSMTTICTGEDLQVTLPHDGQYTLLLASFLDSALNYAFRLVSAKSHDLTYQLGDVVAGTEVQPALLPLTRLAADGMYAVRVSGSTESAYELELFKNAAVETRDSADGDEFALDDTLISLGSGRFAVVASFQDDDSDEFSIDLTDYVGSQIDVVLAGINQTFNDESLELLAPDGTTVLATGSHAPLGVAATNYDLAILGFEIPAGGVYSIRTSSATDGRYGLLITQHVLFDSEPNQDPEVSPLRTLEVGGSGLGYLTGDPDSYQLFLEENQVVVLTTATPLDGATSPQNKLDPQIIVLDPEGNVLAVATGGLPDGRNVKLSLVAQVAGIYTIQVDSESGDGEYVLHIQPNQPPLATSDTGFEIDEDSLLEISAPGVLDNDSDPDDHPLSVVGYDVLSVQGSPVVVHPNGSYSYDPRASAAIQSLSAGVSLDDTFTYTVRDSELSAIATVTITVAGVNDPPTFPSPGDPQFDELATLLFNLNGMDVDTDDVLSYSLVSGDQPGMELDADTGAFRWTPHEDQDGAYTVVFRVTDNHLVSADQTITITVDDLNEPPSFPSPSSPTVDELATLNLDLSAADMDIAAGIVDSVTYSLVSGSQPGMTLDENSGAFSWSPTESQDGQHTIVIRATDNHSASSEQTVTITVREVNQPPLLTDPGNQAVVVSVQLSLTLLATDDDVILGVNDLVRFSIEDGEQSGMALNADTGLFTWTPTEFQTGEYSVTFRASDEQGGMHDRTITILVNELNEAPTDIVLSNEDVDENAAGAVVSTVSVADPNTKQTHTYSVSDPRFEVVGNELKLLDGVALDFEEAANVTLSITVTDSGTPAKSLTQTFTISVNDVNDPPSSIALTPDSIVERLSGAVVGTLSATDDDDGQAHTFTVSDERFEVIESTLRLKADQYLDRTEATTVTIEVTATDSGSPSQSTARTLVIQVVEHSLPWHHSPLPEDTNADGMVVPLDVLRVINQVNSPTILDEQKRLPASRPADSTLPYYDVNGDNFATSNDALRIINFLNRGGAEGELPDAEQDPNSFVLFRPALSANNPDECSLGAPVDSVFASYEDSPMVYFPNDSHEDHDADIETDRQSLEIGSPDELELLLDELAEERLQIADTCRRGVSG